MKAMRRLIKRAALPAIALALAASATGCAANSKAQAVRSNPAKGEAIYYRNQVRNSELARENPFIFTS
jgi:hypothetical protein